MRVLKAPNPTKKQKLRYESNLCSKGLKQTMDLENFFTPSYDREIIGAKMSAVKWEKVIRVRDIKTE